MTSNPFASSADLLGSTLEELASLDFNNGNHSSQSQQPSSSLLDNPFADSNSPFTDDHHEHEFPQPPASYRAPLKQLDDESLTQQPKSPPSKSNAQSPTMNEGGSTSGKAAGRQGTLKGVGRPQDLPDDAVEMLSKVVGRDIDLRDLFRRLERTLENAEAWARGEKGHADHDHRLKDLSKHPLHGEDPESAHVSYDSAADEGRPKPASLRKRAAAAFRKALGITIDNEQEPSGRSHGSMRPLTHFDGSNLPPPPPAISSDDYLSLSIYYHEKDELELSAYYLEKSAKENNPLGLYLLGLALRHGWGVPEDKEQAFRMILLSAETSLMTITEIADRRKTRKDNDSVSLSSKSSKTRPADLRSLRSYATVASLLPSDIDTAVALLPLPLYEIAICFRQGWGVLKSYPAAVYYFGIAARLGDADAMYELGYCYLNGTGVSKSNKMLAAQWLREADKLGKKVVGESWIWKAKWGGPEEDDK